MSQGRDLRAWIAERNLLAGDGAMGTMLQSAGLTAGGCPEIWNSDRPDEIEGVLRAYREAGAELLETNSFGASPHKLGAYGIADRCEELNLAAAKLGRKAAGDQALVLGSIGPTGALLQPYGPLAEEEAFEGFKQQTEALAEGGVDAFCIETMIDVTEASLALKAASATGLPVMVTMTFDVTPRGFFTIMGTNIPTAARALADLGAAVLGTNCGTGPEPMIEMVRALRNVTDLPILVQPNAGLPELVAGEVHYPESPETMASFVAPLVEAGATLVGGCCGTTAEHIRAMSAEVKRLRATR